MDPRVKTDESTTVQWGVAELQRPIPALSPNHFCQKKSESRKINGGFELCFLRIFRIFAGSKLERQLAQVWSKCKKFFWIVVCVIMVGKYAKETLHTFNSLVKKEAAIVQVEPLKEKEAVMINSRTIKMEQENTNQIKKAAKIQEHTLTTPGCL